VHARAGRVNTAKGLQELRAVLDKSRKTGQPVLIDFWASWCKSCAAMEQTTLRDSGVRRKLEGFLVVRIQAEDLSDAELKPVLDELGVPGLPTFVVVKPVNESEKGSNPGAPAPVRPQASVLP
jgi:thiol:disulfide interchange protein